MAFVSRTPRIKFPKRYRGDVSEFSEDAKVLYGKLVFGSYNRFKKTFEASVKTDIRKKAEWGFGYGAGLAGLYFCYRNGDTSKIREEVAGQSKLIGGLVDEVGRCYQSQFACWNLFSLLGGSVVNMKSGS